MSDFGSLLFYICSFLLSGLFFSFYKNRNVFVRWCGVFISILIPTLIAGCRYNVGRDYSVYNSVFIIIKNNTFHEIISGNLPIEKGFLLLAKIIITFCSNKAAFGIFALLILMIFTFTLFEQYREYDLTVCYLFFLFSSYVNSLNIMRQYLAVVIVFYGMKYIFENKKVLFFGVVACASMIHFSALMTVPLWFLWGHKSGKVIKTEKLVIIYGICIFIVFTWRELLTVVLRMDIPFIDKYSRYLISNEGNNRSFYIELLILVGCVAVAAYAKNFNEKIKYFICIYAIGVVIEFTGFYITYVKRIGIYYTLPIGIIFTEFPQIFTQRSRGAIKFFIIGYAVLYFVLSAYVLGQADLIPYRWN